MNKKNLLKMTFAFFALAAPILALDQITAPMINAIYESKANTAHGDSLKIKLEENVLSLFGYRDAGQSRHPDILDALGQGVTLLRAQYIQRQAAATNQGQLDSLAASIDVLNGYQNLLDSLSQNP